LKKLILPLLFVAFSVQIASSGEYDRQMTWLRLMQESKFEEQKDILQTLFDPTDRVVAQFESESLRESLHGERYAGYNAELIEEFQVVLVDRLGELNCKESAEDIHGILDSTTNSQLKRNSAIALAKIGSDEYTDDIIKILSDANSKQYFLVSNGYSNSVLDNEKTAYSAVIALEYLRDESAYEILLRAYSCGYSEESGIKERALKAMDYITDNPIRLLKEISDREHSDETRGIILDIGQKSKAIDVQKVDLAAYLFAQAILNDYELGDYMMEAGALIYNSPYKVPGAEKAIEKILEGSYDSKLTSLAINIAPHCQNGVEVLSDYLKEQNILTKRGNTQYKDHRNVLEVIRTLGGSGDKSAIDQLIVAKSAGWPKEISQAAETALNTLLIK